MELAAARRGQAPPGPGAWLGPPWYQIPFAGRYAHVWMWAHGGFDVLPPGGAHAG